jgi:hypothetical protein
VGIASDSVDPELVDKPRRWDMRFIARFMVEFGVLSSMKTAAIREELECTYRLGTAGAGFTSCRPS